MRLVAVRAGFYAIVEQGYAEAFAPTQLQLCGINERRQANLTIDIFHFFHNFRERNVSQII